MKTIRLAIFVIVALAQLAVPASAIWKREQTLRHGHVWKFKTAPVDPVDVIRGRYIALRFAAETVPAPKPADSEEIPGGADVYLTLKEGADGFAQVEKVSTTPATGDNILKGENRYWSEEGNHVRFPFNQFWVREQNAAAAETAYRENSRREKQNAYVTVRIRNGDAVMEQLYIDNQPLPDYLRDHVTR
jgi:uncharacterized membrane-anchored protein